MVHLRCHVLEGAYPGSAYRVILHLGNAEISQLISPLRTLKDILRFNIPMDDSMGLTQLQCPANIHRNVDHRCFRNLQRQHSGHRSQQFHLYVNIPANAAALSLIVHIITVNHIRAAVQLSRQRVLLHDSFELILKDIFDSLLIVALLTQNIDPVRAEWDGYHLQRGLFNISKHISLDLIYCADAAFSQALYRLPAGP